MTTPKGKFVLHEQIRDDLDAAARSYRAVFGWNIGDAGRGELPYRIAEAGEYRVVGPLHIPDDAKALDAPPRWTGYIGVEDGDAALGE